MKKIIFFLFIIASILFFPEKAHANLWAGFKVNVKTMVNGSAQPVNGMRVDLYSTNATNPTWHSGSLNKDFSCSSTGNPVGPFVNVYNGTSARERDNVRNVLGGRTGRLYTSPGGALATYTYQNPVGQVNFGDGGTSKGMAYGYACSCKPLKVRLYLTSDSETTYEIDTSKGTRGIEEGPSYTSKATWALGTDSVGKYAEISTGHVSNDTTTTMTIYVNPANQTTTTTVPVTTTTKAPQCTDACTTDPECASRNLGCDKCIGGTCKTPACGITCTIPADCETAKDGCTACLNNKCTKPPVCSDACTTDPECASRNLGCDKCIGGTCKTPACGITCTIPADCETAKDGCTYCFNNKCSPFNPATCTCDGIEYTAIFAGSDVTITSFSKIVGADVNNAKVVSEKFMMTKGLSIENNTIIAQSGDIQSQIISNSSSLVRYQTQWKVKLPSNLEPGATYTIWNTINCQPKSNTVSYNSSNKMNVLGAQSAQSAQVKPSFMNLLSQFFANLFGSSKKANNTQTYVLNADSTTTTILTGDKTLQLQTIKPAIIIEKGCHTLRFKIPE
jgi:hypothetical protein